jgi:hypothetical protein
MKHLLSSFLVVLSATPALAADGVVSRLWVTTGTYQWNYEQPASEAGCGYLEPTLKTGGLVSLSPDCGASTIRMREFGTGCEVTLTKTADGSYTGDGLSCAFSGPSLEVFGVTSLVFSKLSLDCTAGTLSYSAVRTRTSASGPVSSCIHVEETLSPPT